MRPSKRSTAPLSSVGASLPTKPVEKQCQRAAWNPAVFPRDGGLSSPKQLYLHRSSQRLRFLPLPLFAAVRQPTGRYFAAQAVGMREAKDDLFLQGVNSIETNNLCWKVGLRTPIHRLAHHAICAPSSLISLHNLQIAESTSCAPPLHRLT